MLAARLSMRASSCVTVDMISLDDCSTLAARSFTASATTAKPAPASPARLASTVALNATSRVCSAICVMSVAALATSRSEVTTPSTPSPTCATAVARLAHRDAAGAAAGLDRAVGLHHRLHVGRELADLGDLPAAGGHHVLDHAVELGGAAPELGRLRGDAADRAREVGPGLRRAA